MARRTFAKLAVGVVAGWVLLFLAVMPVLAEPGMEPSTATGAITYVVKPGDTLYAIAWRHHVSLSSLVRANGLSNPNRIYPHQLLTIPSAQPRILITSPLAGSSVASPVTIAGDSETFEGHVALRILDANLRVIGQGYAIGGSMGVRGSFTASVSFTSTVGQEGLIEAWWDSPEDGSELDTVSIPVNLSLGGSSTPRTYTVRRGDNLYRIALRFGTTVKAIAVANGIRDLGLIYVGQVLRIP